MTVSNVAGQVMLAWNANTEPDLAGYDALGNVLTATQYANVTSLSRKTVTQYDLLNRPVTTTANYVDGSFSWTQIGIYDND